MRVRERGEKKDRRGRSDDEEGRVGMAVVVERRRMVRSVERRVEDEARALAIVVGKMGMEMDETVRSEE